MLLHALTRGWLSRGIATQRDRKAESMLGPRKELHMTRSPQETLAAHFEAIASGDIDRLLADYSEDATMLTEQGSLAGHPGVQAFYTNALQSLPGAEFSITDATYSSDAALVHWTAHSGGGRVDDGVDTFVFQDGEIRLHTVHFTVQPA
ncbi:MAG: nuclear transport factor 2 family protein [Nocardioidaceae bacterium]